MWRLASLQVKEVRLKEMKVHTASVETGISTGEWSETEVLRVHLLLWRLASLQVNRVRLKC